ncbi:MAG: hypothetical protein KTR31_23665 [Myxococcales bacterium]|nr:hypothetical protein [Myxococcales bacterium]
MLIEPTTEPEPTGTTPVPDFDHAKLPETQLCWECHEKERDGLDHYAAGGPLDPVTSWDCGGCHTATSWEWEPFVHPVRIPHGVENGPEDCAPRLEEEWLTGCVGCHPNGTDTFECFNCHRDPDDPKEPVHGGTWELNQCLTCHIDAEPDNCVD